MTLDISALLIEETNSYALSSWTGKFGSSDVTLYAKPLSPRDNERVLAKCPDFNTSMRFAGMVEYILIKAQGEDGKPVFNLGKDRPVMMRMKQDKIAEIFTALFGDQIDGVDDQEIGQLAGN